VKQVLFAILMFFVLFVITFLVLFSGILIYLNGLGFTKFGTLIPWVISQILLPSTIASILLSFLVLRTQNPRFVPLTLILMFIFGSLIAGLLLELVPIRFFPPSTRSGNWIETETMYSYGNGLLYVHEIDEQQRVSGLYLLGNRIQTLDKSDFFDQESLENPVGAQVYTVPAGLADMAEDIAMLNENLRQLRVRDPEIYLLSLILLVLVTVSCWGLGHFSRWPLVNLILIIFSTRGVFLLYRFTVSDFSKTLAAQILTLEYQNYFPLIILSFAAIVLMFLTLVVTGRKIPV
jgi:hypothetical protein